jgi:hypothetical protein
MEPVDLALRHVYIRGIREDSKCDKLDSALFYMDNYGTVYNLRWDLLMFLHPREIERMIINEINET